MTYSVGPLDLLFNNYTTKRDHTLAPSDVQTRRGYTFGRFAARRQLANAVPLKLGVFALLLLFVLLARDPSSNLTR